VLQEILNFFGRNSFGSAHGISGKVGLWTFHKLWKRQKKFHITDFGCSNHDIFLHESSLMFTLWCFFCCSVTWTCQWAPTQSPVVSLPSCLSPPGCSFWRRQVKLFYKF